MVNLSFVLHQYIIGQDLYAVRTLTMLVAHIKYLISKLNKLQKKNMKYYNIIANVFESTCDL